MRLSDVELVLVALIIMYIAFFTRPSPNFIESIFESPVGHALALGSIFYVAVYESLIVAVFLGLAYVMTNAHVTEYMDNKNKKKKKEKEKTSDEKEIDKLQEEIDKLKNKAKDNKKKDKASKLDSLVPAVQQKGTVVTPPTETSVPVGSTKKIGETFATFN
jgi:uncharacterized protein YlxW (UPF0749 family)